MLAGDRREGLLAEELRDLPDPRPQGRALRAVGGVRLLLLAHDLHRSVLQAQVDELRAPGRQTGEVLVGPVERAGVHGVLVEGELDVLADRGSGGLRAPGLEVDHHHATVPAELLSEYEFPGDDLPVVRVSALKALEGDKEWGAKLLELMAAVDSAIPEPTRNAAHTVFSNNLMLAPRVIEQLARRPQPKVYFIGNEYKLMPEKMQFLPRKEVLSLEEMHKLALGFIDRGITKIRLTGGEPLVRRNVEWLIDELGSLIRALDIATSDAIGTDPLPCSSALGEDHVLKEATALRAARRASV